MSKEEVVVTCGATVARCVCVKPAGHVESGDRVHTCDSGCGGAWAWPTDDPRDFEVVEFPSAFGTGLPR